MSEIQSMHRCQEGIELIVVEQRGMTKRNYLYSVIISKEELKKINKLMDQPICKEVKKDEQTS